MDEAPCIPGLSRCTDVHVHAHGGERSGVGRERGHTKFQERKEHYQIRILERIS